ncbi:hypothetical protein [Bilophila wadsworthia]|uniref:hypothetical protein n=1 Tax=Bilophila wadsworthia TaxID=35833 RepID=UPI003990566B
MHLIACEVFRPELERLTRAMRNAPEVTYLEQGLHDTRTNSAAAYSKPSTRWKPRAKRSFSSPTACAGAGLPA